MRDLFLGIGVAVCTLIVAYFARRDRKWRKVRIGVFIERERYDNSDEEEGRQ